MNLTQDEVLELAKEAGFNPKLLSERFISFATAITAKLQEKSQGEAVAIKAIPFATVRWQESLPDVMGNRKREAYIQEIYPAIYPEHGTTLYRLDGIKQNSLLVDRKSLELCLHPAPPQPQTVKDALEKAIANIKQCRQPIVYPDENQVSISCYHEGLDKACQVIRALIDQPAEQPAQSQELINIAKISDKELLEFGISEELLLFADESDYIAIAQGVLELVQDRLNKALQSKPAKG